MNMKTNACDYRIGPLLVGEEEHVDDLAAQTPEEHRIEAEAGFTFHYASKGTYSTACVRCLF